MTKKTLLVTVGTTSYPGLIRRIADEEILTACEQLGFTKIIIQHGKGNPAPITSTESLQIEQIRFINDFLGYISKADVIIAHAGAGSILDVFKMDKPLIVIPNNTLMNNHQEELAQELAARGHVVHVVGGPNSLNKSHVRRQLFIPIFSVRKSTER